MPPLKPRPPPRTQGSQPVVGKAAPLGSRSAAGPPPPNSSPRIARADEKAGAQHLQVQKYAGLYWATPPTKFPACPKGLQRETGAGQTGRNPELVSLRFHPAWRPGPQLPKGKGNPLQSSGSKDPVLTSSSSAAGEAGTPAAWAGTGGDQYTPGFHKPGGSCALSAAGCK